MNINGISFTPSFACNSSVDSEEKEIMRRLLAYGITPTGNKTTDKAKLREIEINKAKNSNFVILNLLTVSKAEQEQIQKKKKDKRKETEKQTDLKDLKGLDCLGRQIYLSIQMKNKEKLKEKKKNS